MGDNALSALPSVEEMLGAINETRERMETDEEFYKSLVDPHPSGNPITLGRRIPTPARMTELQLKGVRDNKQKWLDNTTKPKKNFKEEALKPDAVERYKESMRLVIAEDRHKGGMELVDESETMAIIKKVGAEGYAKATEAREAKILRAHESLDSDRLALASTVDGLPTVTDDDREAKMIANVRGLKAIGKKRRGG